MNLISCIAGDTLNKLYTAFVTLNAVLMYLLIALVIVAVLVLIVYGVTRAKKGGSKKSEAPEFDMGQSYY